MCLWEAAAESLTTSRGSESPARSLGRRGEPRGPAGQEHIPAGILHSGAVPALPCPRVRLLLCSWGVDGDAVSFSPPLLTSSPELLPTDVFVYL